jgi:hypothetical protein
MATRHSHQSDKPPVDEWGIYDPSQAGLEAVFGRLLALGVRNPMPDTDSRRMAASMEDVKRLTDARGTSKKA